MNAHVKKFCMQKGISFIDNNGIKGFLGERKLHLYKKGNNAFGNK